MDIIKEFCPLDLSEWGTCMLKTTLRDRAYLIEEAQRDFPRLLPGDITEVLQSAIVKRHFPPITGIKFEASRKEIPATYRIIGYPEVLV